VKDSLVLCTLRAKGVLKIGLEKALRYTLAALLVLGAFMGMLIALLNPESYFFGSKLGGWKASIHLVVNSAIALLSLHYVIEDKPFAKYLPVLYFLYNTVNVLITNFLLGFGMIPSPFFTLGLTVSIIYFYIKR